MSRSMHLRFRCWGLADMSAYRSRLDNRLLPAPILSPAPNAPTDVTLPVARKSPVFVILPVELINDTELGLVFYLVSDLNILLSLHWTSVARADGLSKDRRHRLPLYILLIMFMCIVSLNYIFVNVFIDFQ